MADRNETNRRVRRAGLALTGALAITALGGITATEAKSPAAIVIEGQMPTRADAPITVFQAFAEKAADIIPVRKIESAEVAAQRFGADAYSSDPANWEINEYGGATLKEDLSGHSHRINTNGAVFEGYINTPEEGIDSLVLVVNPTNVKKMDFNGATAWDFKPTDRTQGFQQVKTQVRQRIRDIQPGVIVESVNNPEITGHKSITPAKIASPEVAAAKYGVDDWSKNPANWQINEYGGATLLPDPSGLDHRIKNTGAVTEGYVNEDRVNGTDALAFVSIANGQLDVYSATVWQPKNTRERKPLFKQVFVQNKRNQHDGILVIPIS